MPSADDGVRTIPPAWNRGFRTPSRSEFDQNPEMPRFPRDAIFETQRLAERSIAATFSSKYLRRRMATFHENSSKNT
jgi:hypothetical protein